MPNEPGSYADIRQIVTDAVNPIKEQLDRIYDSLTREFARKDVVEPKIEELQKRMEKLEDEVVSTPQKLLIAAAAVIGLILSILSLAQYIHLH